MPANCVFFCLPLTRVRVKRTLVGLTAVPVSDIERPCSLRWSISRRVLSLLDRFLPSDGMLLDLQKICLLLRPTNLHSAQILITVFLNFQHFIVRPEIESSMKINCLNFWEEFDNVEEDIGTGMRGAKF